MINEINLRTNKGEYQPGEAIYGVVYLRILSPTSGCGVALKIHGYEHFVYEQKSDTRQGNNRKYEEHRDYIDYEVILFENKEPLTMGNTLYPFKIPLPKEIPGTFSHFSETEEVRWEARVDYKLEAYVIDASKFLTTSQAVLIVEALPRGVSAGVPPEEVSVTYHKTFALFFTTSINLKARLSKHSSRSGESADLQVVIDNRSSVQVQSMTIQLLRSMILISRRRELKLSSKEDPNISADSDDDEIVINVETRKSVINKQHFDMIPFQKGMKNIQVSLSDRDNKPICPTVNGQFIKVKYEIHMEVHLSNGGMFDLDLPVTGVWPSKNRAWNQWTCPNWVLNSDPAVYLGTHVLRVSEIVLSSPAFSCIPGFHPK